MPRFVATYNESACVKLRQRKIKPLGRQLVFFEDDLTTARVFFRRYVRNFFGVKLHDRDFSLYALNEAAPSRMGLLTEDSDDIPQSTPGMCGARPDQPNIAP